MSDEIEVRALTTFPKTETPFSERKSGAQFKSTVGATLNLLRYEMRAIGAENPVLELDLRPHDLRRDGWLRSDARPLTPRVVVSFSLPDVGPIRYPCDTYESWEANVRGIALSLQALRAVDRHGVTTGRREQYRGFTALPPGVSAEDYLTPDAAARVLLTWDPLAEKLSDGVREAMVPLMVQDAVFAEQVAKRVLVALHPDTNQDPGATGKFQRASRAREVLIGKKGGS